MPFTHKRNEETQMVPSLSSNAVIRLALAATAAIAISACQSKPKPAVPTQPGETAPPSTPLPPTPPPVSGQPTGPLPGSTQDFVVNVGDRVYFDTDAYEIRGDAAPILDAQTAWLRQYPNVRIRIEGNCDERGTREYNLALGARRANAVRDYLVSHGVSADRISTISFGKEQPIDPGNGEDAWQKNRNAHTAIVAGAR
jgi:peptidoglycan-associated lipoprotein